GATLAVSLIMLVLLTLIAVSAINSSTSNLRITGNMQTTDEARSAAKQGIETVLSNISYFKPTPTGLDTYLDVNNAGANTYHVVVSAPVCRSAGIATKSTISDCKNGAKSGLFCWSTLWDLSATA